MNVQVLDVNHPKWLEILQTLRHDVYHLPEYLQIESQRTTAKPEAIAIADGDKTFFVPYLLRYCQELLTETTSLEPIFDITSPYGYPGILLNEAALKSPEFLNTALMLLKQSLKSKGICSAFFRLHPLLSDRFKDIFQVDTLTEAGETVSVNLSLSESEIWAHTRKGHQSTINKCKRLGLSARMIPFSVYMNEFVQIYEETMHRVSAHDMYYFDQNYFQGLLTLGEKLHLGVVEFDQQIICASLFFECCGIVQAHLGGTKTAFLSQSPFNLLLHYARLWAKERGNEFLHLGGGVGGSKEDKLYVFKSGFSRQRHNFLTLRLIIDEEKYLYLVNLKAQVQNKSVETLLRSSFFPVYRAL